MKTTKLVLIFLALTLCIGLASANTASYSGKTITIYSNTGQKAGTYENKDRNIYNILKDGKLKILVPGI